MKTHIPLIILLLSIPVFVSAQEATKSLPSFSKIVVSPRISLVLIKGEKESVRLLCNNIAPEKVNVRVHGNKLQIYLDHARFVEKQVKSKEGYWKKGIYSDVSVTAYVTYKELKALEIRGESEISSEDVVASDKLKLRAYGKCEINLTSINVRKFKASLYGENTVKIAGGLANREVFRIFGETKIDTKGLICATASVRMYGEGKLSLNATDEVSLMAFGETQLVVSGNAIISNIVIGKGSVYRE